MFPDLMVLPMREDLTRLGVEELRTPEEVDKLMRICCNFPMGPLELCDLVGAEIVLHGLETMQKEFGDRFRPAPLLKAMVRAGDIGRKTGRGFYDYTRKPGESERSGGD